MFENRWWLDAACGHPCDEVSVVWNGHCVGTLFFHRTKRLGMTRLRMPPFTRTLAPVLAPPASKPAQRVANMRRIVQELVRALPPHDIMELALDPSEGHEICFAFEQAGAQVGQTFTFRTRAFDTPEVLWQGLDQKTRNVIRSASQRCGVPEAVGFDRFACLFESEHGDDGAASLPVLRRLYDAAAARGQAEIRVVRMAQSDAAAVMLVWDQAVMYLLASARARTAPGGANAMLVWDAIGLACNRRILLDLDGYKTPGSARFLASFGLPPIPRTVISRRSFRYEAAAWTWRHVSRLGG